MADPETKLPKELWKFAEKPFGGFFSDAVITHVVQEIVADPSSEVTPTELAYLLGKSYNSVNMALRTLAGLNFLIKDNRDPQRPVYKVNLHSKRLVALTFFELADLDDREGSDYMDRAIFEYCSPEMSGDFTTETSSTGDTVSLGNTPSVGVPLRIGNIEARCT